MIENKSPRFFYGYAIVLVSFFILMVMFGTFYSFGVFFKPLLAEFGWTRAMTSGAFSLCLLLMGLFSIVMGKLTDRLGPRMVVTACGLFLGLGYLLMSQVTAIWQLYLFYGVLVGIGMSGGFVPLVSTVARWFVGKRGLMTGITVSGVGMGTVIMPLLANWLISTYNWSTSYIIVGVIALVLIILAAQFLKRHPGQIGQLPYDESKVKEENSNLESRGFPLGGAIRTRQLWMLSVAHLSFEIGLNAIMVHVVLHATELKIPATVAVSILSVIGGLGIAGRLIMGGVSDRIGNKGAYIVCFSSVSAAFFWLLVAKELWMLYLFAAIFGFAYGGVIALMSPMIAELFGLSSHGVIMGTITFIATVGSAIGPLLGGRIFDITGSYNLAFLVCAILSALSLIIILLLSPTPR